MQLQQIVIACTTKTGVGSACWSFTTSSANSAIAIHTMLVKHNNTSKRGEQGREKRGSDGYSRADAFAKHFASSTTK
jgi:hypothetical protein